MKNETVVGALRVSDARPGVVVGGSTRGACADCGAAVWVAPSSRKILRLKGAVLSPVSREQAREIAGHLRRN
jgi:hypothetical protein